MILELVLFDNPPGLDRATELEGARAVVAKWRANPDLARKHFMRSEDGTQGGAVYLWKTRRGGRARTAMARGGESAHRLRAHLPILRPADPARQRRRPGHRVRLNVADGSSYFDCGTRGGGSGAEVLGGSVSAEPSVSSLNVGSLESPLLGGALLLG
jgi:hypothetical protein